MNTDDAAKRAAIKEAHAMLRNSPTSFAFQQWFIEQWVRQEVEHHALKKVRPPC